MDRGPLQALLGLVHALTDWGPSHAGDHDVLNGLGTIAHLMAWEPLHTLTGLGTTTNGLVGTLICLAICYIWLLVGSPWGGGGPRLCVVTAHIWAYTL